MAYADRSPLGEAVGAPKFGGTGPRREATRYETRADEEQSDDPG